MKKLKDLDYVILSELIKNSKISDRKLASKIGVSQPTITRRRAGLEARGLLDYTAIPNFEKLGYQIMAFIFASWTAEAFSEMSQNWEEYLKGAKDFLAKQPNMIFVSTGRGLGMSRMAISIHKDYADYVKLMKTFDERWGNYLAKLDSFVVSLKSDKVLRGLTFKHLADYIKRT